MRDLADYLLLLTGDYSKELVDEPESSLSDSDLLDDTEEDLEILFFGVKMISEVSWALSSCS